MTPRFETELKKLTLALSHCNSLRQLVQLLPRKWYETRHKFINKSRIWAFDQYQKSVTLNEAERPNDHHYALFFISHKTEPTACIKFAEARPRMSATKM